MWAGIAGSVANNKQGYEIAISVHDSVYSTDFAADVIPYAAGDPSENAANIENCILEKLRKFSTEHLCKFLGAGVTVTLLKEVPAASIIPRYRNR
jgi:hypothetical protein